MLESGKKTILLVEDEFLIAMNEKLELEKYGYVVKTVTNGEKAIEVVETSTDIDLILMDINLGDGIDGTQAAEIILKDHDIPIVFVSSHSEREVVEKTEKITSYGYVVKNSSITVLDASIKMAFKLFYAQNTLQQKMEVVKATDDRFQLAMNELDGTMWTLDLDLKFTLSRGKGLVSLGLQPDQVIGMRLTEFLQTSDPKNVSLVAHQQALLGESINYEYTHNGLTFRTVVSPLRDYNGNITGVAGIATDITERLTANKVIRESEEKYRLLHEYAGVGIGYYDINGIVLSYNKLAAEHMGGVPEDFIGKSIHDLYAAPDADVYLDRIKKSSTSKTSDVYEDTVTLPTGTVYFLSTFTKVLDVDGNLLGIQILSQNISDRKHAEEALQESKQKTELLLNVAAEIIISLDSHGGITLLNESGHRILGYESPELVGRNWFDTCLPGEDREEIKKYFGLLLAGESASLVSHESDVVTKNGERKTILWHDSLLKDKEGKSIGLFSSGEDITERKKMVADLILQRELNEQIIEQSLAGYWDWDIPTGDEYLSPTFKKMFGYEDREIENKAESWQKLIFAEDLPSVYDKFNSHVESKGKVPFYNEVRYHHKNGSTIWVICTGKVIEWTDEGKAKRMIGCHIDITERKKMEEALEINVRRLESIFEGSHLGTWEWNMQTGKTQVNSIWTEIIGYTLDELASITNVTWEKYVHPDELNQVTKFLEMHVSGALPYYQSEYRMKHKNGNWVWIWSKGKIIKWTDDGRPLMIFGTHSDITERKQAEIQIKSLLEEKELLLKEVHHRIKNNMNTVSSLLSLHASKIDEPKAILALDDAKNRIRSMSMLYDKLYRSQDYSELSIKDYLSLLVDEIIANFPNNQMVKMEKDVQDFILDVKRLQPLGIIINELLTNIMKYAFKGKDSGLIIVSVSKNNNHVMVSIIDDGIGIPESISFANSTGFGLQLVYALAQQLDGSIRIERVNGTKVILGFDV